MTEPPDYLRMPVGEFADALAAARPDPAGGAAAALTVTFAAALCVMCARLSQRRLPSAARLAEDAERLRERAAPLAQADAAGYQAVLAALRAGPGQASQPAPGPDRLERGSRMAAALSEASAVPMAVAEIGAQVAAIAAALAAEGQPAARPDAVTAAMLAAAGAGAAATLVQVNLAGAENDGPARAARLAAQAAADARRARETTGGR